MEKKIDFYYFLEGILILEMMKNTAFISDFYYFDYYLLLSLFYN